MKLAFYSLTGWSIGKVEREAMFYMPSDWDIKWFDIRESHDKNYFHELLADGYQFVSPGYPAVNLMNTYDIPPERIIYTVYDENELLRTVQYIGADVFQRFIRVGCFSQQCRNFLYGIGYNVDPYVLPLGLHVNDYVYRKRNKVNTLGYAQKYERSDTAQGFDIKRGNLALQVSKGTSFPLLKTDLRLSGDAGGPSMNDWYQKVDVLLVSSTIEGGPLTPFEGAACGIPTIGTPVGNFYEFALMGGGIIVDTHPRKYLEESVSVLKWFKENPSAYQELCEEAYSLVQHYDWSKQYMDWQEFLDVDAYL